MQRLRWARLAVPLVLLAAAGGCGSDGDGDAERRGGAAASAAPVVSPAPLPPGLSMLGVDASGSPVQADEGAATVAPASWSRSISISASPSYRHALARSAGGRAVVVGADGSVSVLEPAVAPFPAATNLAFSPDERWLGWHVEREGVKVAELVDGTARGHLVTLPDEVDGAAVFAGWTPDNRIIVAGRDALWTVTVEGKEPRKFPGIALRDRGTGGGIQAIAHSFVQANPATGELAYTDTDPVTRTARLVFTDGGLVQRRTVPDRSLAAYTADGRFYAAQDLADPSGRRLVCSTASDECRTLPQYTLLTPYPNGLLPMQPVSGSQRITVLVDPATARQVDPPAAFGRVTTSRQVLPTVVMRLLAKVAPTG